MTTTHIPAPGIRASNATLLQQMLQNFESADEAVRAGAARFLTMRDHAEDERQQARARAHELREQAGRLIVESYDVEKQAEADFAKANAAANEVITRLGETATDDASFVRQIAGNVRALPKPRARQHG